MSLDKILVVLEEVRDLLKTERLVPEKPRRKVYPGENLDVTLAEVQAGLHQVETRIGKEYVGIILQRIPAASISSLKASEYGRCVRLCQYYLNDSTSPRS